MSLFGPKKKTKLEVDPAVELLRTVEELSKRIDYLEKVRFRAGEEVDSCASGSESDILEHNHQLNEIGHELKHIDRSLKRSIAHLKGVVKEVRHCANKDDFKGLKEMANSIDFHKFIGPEEFRRIAQEVIDDRED